MKKEKLSGPEFRAILRGEEIDEEHVADFNLFDSVLEVEQNEKAQESETKESISEVKDDATESINLNKE